MTPTIDEQIGFCEDIIFALNKSVQKITVLDPSDKKLIKAILETLKGLRDEKA